MSRPGATITRMDTDIVPRRGYSGSDAPLSVPAGLEPVAERVAAGGLIARLRGVTVEMRVPGSIRTGCYYRREVRTIPALTWSAAGRTFVAFVDARGKVRYRESFREPRPPYELQSARTEAQVLFTDEVPR